MGLYIPRLEWNDQSVTATRTSPSPTLSSISSTAAINVGMIASGTGIPSGAKVISKTVSSVTLDANVTLSGTSVIAFVERIDFDFPPTSDTEEQYNPKQTVTESLSGVQQYVTNYLEANRTVKLSFVTSSIADKMKLNFFLYAYKGSTFRWYEDKDDIDYETYELDVRKYARTRVIKKHPTFLYETQMTFRRVVE